MKQELNWELLRHLFNKYHYRHIAGQAIILSSQLLKTKITKEIKLLNFGNQSKRLAQEAIFYCEKMVNLHTEPVPDDIRTYHKRHLFSLMSFQQKCLFRLSLLYPHSIDAETLPLPKKLHFLYFPLRPFLWGWRKIRKYELLGDK